MRLPRNRAKEIEVNGIIFDSYEHSTKNQLQCKRARSASTIVQIEDEIQCLTYRAAFISNYANKNSFIKFLSIWYQCNASTMWCRLFKSWGYGESVLGKKTVDNVVVISDDTDILCLLIHHWSKAALSADVFIKNVLCKAIRTSSNSDDDDRNNSVPKSRLQYNMRDILDSIDETTKAFILFAHACCGTDTTSAIHSYGKLAILQKLKNSEPRTCAKLFYTQNPITEEIGNASVQIMRMQFSNRKAQGNFNLAVIRRLKYDELVYSTRTTVDTLKLPPTARATNFHGFKTYVNNVCPHRAASSRQYFVTRSSRIRFDNA